MSSPQRPKSEPPPELPGEDPLISPPESSRRTSRPRPAPRLGIFVNPRSNRQNDDDSVFDHPMDEPSTSRQSSISYPPREPPHQSNSNHSNNSPRVSLHNAIDPPAGFLPDIELTSNVDESPASCELPPRNSQGRRRCRSRIEGSINEEPRPSQRMRFDDPPRNAFDFNEINHEMFMQELEMNNIDDNDPLDLHNSHNVTSKSSSPDRLHNDDDSND